MRRRLVVGAVLAAVFLAPQGESLAQATDVQIPTGVVARSFKGPAGFTIQFSASEPYVISGETNDVFICPAAQRVDRPDKTTKVVSEVYACDFEFSSYTFDETTWAGSAIGHSDGIKAISTWKYRGGEWQRVGHAERPTRTTIKIRWQPTGPIRNDSYVHPNVGICYWLFLVCPPIVKLAGDRPIALSGSMYFEAFSMPVPVPKGLAGHAWMGSD